MVLQTDENESFREIFNLFDRYGEGVVVSSEIGDMLRTAGMNPTEAEVKKAIQEIDKESINFDEFLPIVNIYLKHFADVASPDSFIEGFRVFDHENNGMVTVGEVRHMLTNLGERLSSADVDGLVSGMEDDRGRINYENFVKAVIEGDSWFFVFVISYKM